MLIREETYGDIDAIHALTQAAFAPMHFSDKTEGAALKALRARGELTISLVAEEAGSIVGHVAFSPVAIDGVHGGWYGLGPISVRPGRQRRGVGKALIARGLDMLRERGAKGCALIGNPQIYSRAGFASDGRLFYRDLRPEYVQRIVFHGLAPTGTLRFASALEDEDLPAD
jgi:putative acetyltransferase